MIYSLAALVGAVLMVGHSLIGPHQPQMLDHMLSARGIDAPVEAQIINGAPLHYNWDQGFLADGVNARDRLAEGGVTHLILTEAIPLATHLKWSDPQGSILRYFNAAHAMNPDVQVFLQETWHDLRSGSDDAPVDSDPGATQDWRGRLADDLERWQSIVDDVNAQRPQGSRPAVLLPVGQAFAALDDAIAAGKVPGIGRTGDLFSDNIHLTHAGHYFVALVQFAVLTGQSPQGLPDRISDRYGRPYRTPEPATAAAMQDVVAEFVAAQVALPLHDNTASSTQPVTDAPARAMPTGIPPLPDAGPPAQVPVALNLAPLSDWSTQAPLIDLMKTARPWIGHVAGRWGGMDESDLIAEGILDANGWPTRIPNRLGSIGTVILTDLPEEAVDMAGRYLVTYDGDGILEFGGRARDVRYGTGQASFAFTPGPGPVEIRIQRSDRRRTGDYLRNIRIMHEDHAAAFAEGAVFNPRWIEHVKGFAAVRFMDWMDTNNSDIRLWSQRPVPDLYTYQGRGMPLELMLRLVAETGADPWFNLPHQADDDFILRFAAMVRDGLPQGRKAYVEYSNEVWNWQFKQAAWADAQARARWGAKDAWVQFYAMRAAQIAEMFSETFGLEAPERLVNVISTQTGWRGLEDPILTAPLFVAEDPANNVAPAFYFDAYAITGYFGGLMGHEDGIARTRAWIAESLTAAQAAADAEGLRGDARAAFVERHRYDQAIARAAHDVMNGTERGSPRNTVGRLINNGFRYHKDVADAWGLDLLVYEGGTHILGLGPLVDDAQLTDFLIAFNYSPEMGTIYEYLLQGWQRTGGGNLFAAFSDVMAPTKWGSWGNLRHLSDDTGRWRALRAAMEAYRGDR